MNVTTDEGGGLMFQRMKEGDGGGMLQREGGGNVTTNEGGGNDTTDEGGGMV